MPRLCPISLPMLSLLAILLAPQAFAQPAAQPPAAEPAAPPSDVSPTSLWQGPVAVDAGLLLGTPAALGTGQTAGISAGVTGTGTLTWGARASWSRAQEDSLLWAVTHNEVRLRGMGVLQRHVGRGTIALQVAAGGTAIHESRDRHQAARLSASGTGLSTTAWSLAPGGELELAVTLRIMDEWGIAVAAGPSTHWIDGSLQTGWVATLGVAWLP